jgi:hypothetical protein
MKTIGSSVTTLTHIFCANTIRKLEATPVQAKDRYLVALSLAEGETIRRMIHLKQQNVLKHAAIALRSADGRILDMSPTFFEEHPSSGTAVYNNNNNNSSTADRGHSLVSMGIQCFRFFNCEMYYSDSELEVLEFALRHSSLDNRLQFFLECLRLRRRERNMWADTPVAKIFLPQQEWHLIRTRAILEQINKALQKAVREKHHDIYALFNQMDEDGDGSLDYQEMQRLLEWLQLGFSPKDYYEVIRFADTANKGYVECVTQQSM